MASPKSVPTYLLQPTGETTSFGSEFWSEMCSMVNPKGGFCDPPASSPKCIPSKALGILVAVLVVVMMMSCVLDSDGVDMAEDMSGDSNTEVPQYLERS